MSSCEVDTLFVSCHICGREIGHTDVPHGAKLLPWRVIKMHEQMIRHVRREHLRKRSA